ncbi:MAG: alpha/beta hydrolase fold domain-containing protein [Fibrobacter sp.]|nr:alpha/beta hydrolase fold domain-containing protein [Fibrobacter sp.]
MRRLLTSLLLVLSFCVVHAQETHLFAQRDTCQLYLDFFRAAEGSETTFQGQAKPTIIHVFGGGFITGTRNESYFRGWIDQLNREGYNVVTFDYRLGMKGYKVGKGLSGTFKASEQFEYSQQIGVEDLFSAISYLAEHPELGIDTSNMVVAGNSAGAIISLAAVREIANGTAQGLPEGFHFKGALSFAGGIISAKGTPKFESAPCPVMLMHGTADKAVAYNKLAGFGRGIWGSSYWARKFKRQGYPYCIYRFKDRTHEVASYHLELWDLEKQFLQENVMLGHTRVVDTVVDDPTLPKRLSISMDDIYNAK